MARSTYEPRVEYIGDGTLAEYTFDFQITSLEHLLIGVITDAFVQTFEVRGDDVTFLDSVEFSVVDGGGTITLASNLPAGHLLYILLADDQPSQDSEFKDKGSFTLSRFEAALDALNGQIQHLSYLALRSVKLWNGFPDSDSFDPTVPINSTDQGVQDTANRVIAVNDDGDGLQLGPSLVDLAQEAADAIQAAADAAAAAADAADSAAAAAASAAAAATSGVQNLGAVGSSPNPNGATIAAQTLTLQPASAAQPGVLTAIAQVIGGVKTFFDRIIKNSETGIIAFAGGGQASATVLTKQINKVTTVASDFDSVKLPAAAIGEEIVVINQGSKILSIYPASGENFDGRSANTAYRLGIEQFSVRFTCAEVGVWTAEGKNVLVLGTVANPILIDPTVGFSHGNNVFDQYADEQTIICQSNTAGTTTISATPPIGVPSKVGMKLTIINSIQNPNQILIIPFVTASLDLNGDWLGYDGVRNNVLDLIGSEAGVGYQERGRKF